MTAALALVPPADTSPVAELVSTWLTGRSPETVNAYQRDLRAFAAWLGTEPLTAIATLLESQWQANARGLQYRGAMLDAGLSPATVNRRLAALKSIVKVARLVGLVAWRLDVEPVASRAYRDTRGPGVEAVRKLIAHLAGLDTWTGRRDHALVRLLADLALRVSEACSLDTTDVLDDGRLRVTGKGRREAELLELPAPTRAALEDWRTVRGPDAGPLFLSAYHGVGTRQVGERLERFGVNGLLHKYGQALHIPGLRPHGLRHTAVTTVLECNGGDVRAAAQFSRHKDLNTVLVYDDARRGQAGKMAALAAESYDSGS